MRVPVSMMIGGKRVRIEYPEVIAGDTADEGDISGEMVTGKNLIRVSKSRHSTEREVFRTIWHEATHFAFEVSGHSAEWTASQEEPLVYCLENMLADLFAFHPNAPIKYRDIEWPGEDD